MQLGKTHKFPHGRPLPIVVLEIALAAAVVLWVVFGLRSWQHTVLLAAVFLVLAGGHSNLLGSYEKTGRAVPIVRSRTVVNFINRLPFPVLMLRGAFFLVVGTMLVFGFAPMATATARLGIIVCLLVLFLMPFIQVFLELYYLRKGRAKEIEL